MKNIARKTKNKTSNVINIDSHPRFTPQKNGRVGIPNSLKKGEDYVCYQITKRIYGFMEGDQIICQQNFNLNKITPKTLVIAVTPTGRDVVPASSIQHKDIVAVVVGVTREVAQ